MSSLSTAQYSLPVAHRVKVALERVGHMLTAASSRKTIGSHPAALQALLADPVKKRVLRRKDAVSGCAAQVELGDDHGFGLSSHFQPSGLRIIRSSLRSGLTP